MNPPPMRLADMANRDTGPSALAAVRWHLLARNPNDLRLHPSIDSLGLLDLEMLNSTARGGDSSGGLTAVNVEGIILFGADVWLKAMLDGLKSIECIQCSLSEHDALMFILRRLGPRRGWPAFNRISLALTLEPVFQGKALTNIRAGGKYKALAILPEANRIDVRQEIADVAGLGVRNVSKVKIILARSAPAIREALRNGLLSINKAERWASLSWKEQTQQFSAYDEERSHGRIIRKAVGPLPIETPPR